MVFPERKPLKRLAFQVRGGTRLKPGVNNTNENTD
jgi:hypothetical protein